MAIIEQIPVDLGSHTLLLDTGDEGVKLDLFAKEPPGNSERAAVTIGINKLQLVIEKLGKAGGNITTP
jgi:hypothetical protein